MTSLVDFDLTAGASVDLGGSSTTTTSNAPPPPPLPPPPSPGCDVDLSSTTGFSTLSTALEPDMEASGGGDDGEATDVTGQEEAVAAAVMGQTAAADALTVVALSRLNQREEQLQQRGWEVERREQDVRRMEEEVKQREEAVMWREKEKDIWWEHLNEYEAEVTASQHDVEQRFAEVTERQHNVDQRFAELEQWVKQAKADWTDRETKMRRREDELRWGLLLLKEEQEEEESKLRKEMASRACEQFEAGFLRWNDEERAPLTQPLLAPQPTHMSKPTPTPSNTLAWTTTATATPKDTDTAVDKATATGTPKPKEDDETWNNGQIGYIFDLGTAVAVLFLVRPLLPAGYDGWMLVAFAVVWGLGIVGYPVRMFGTSRFEKNFSRHVGRFITMCLSLLVIYAIYLLTPHVDGTPTSAPSPSSSSGADDQVPIGHSGDELWMVCFSLIGALVLAGHIYFWIRGCYTGGDRDRIP